MRLTSAMNPTCSAAGFAAGCRLKPHNRCGGKGSALFGALQLGSQRFYWKRVERGSSKGLLEFLTQLHRRFPETLLVVILDNATIHTSRLVKEFLQRHDWIEFEYLTPYSPEYNPIERFWQWLKAKLYGVPAPLSRSRQSWPECGGSSGTTMQDG